MGTIEVASIFIVGAVSEVYRPDDQAKNCSVTFMTRTGELRVSVTRELLNQLGVITPGMQRTFEVAFAQRGQYAIWTFIADATPAAGREPAKASA